MTYAHNALKEDTCGLKIARIKSVLRDLVPPSQSVVITFPDYSQLKYTKHHVSWRFDTLTPIREQPDG